MTRGKCSDPIKDAERLAKISTKAIGRPVSLTHRKHLSESRIKNGVAKRERNPNWKGGKINFICTICGKEIQIKAYEKDIRKTCGNKECLKQVFKLRKGEKNPNYKPKVKKTCPICGTEFSDSPKHAESRTCCSHKCMGNWLSQNYSGEQSHAWEGGKSFIPYCVKFNHKRKVAVRTFFNETCICCGVEAKDILRKLGVHHIDHDKEQGCNGKPFNLVPLCPSCHASERHHQKEYRKYINKTLEDGFKWGIWSREQYEKDAMYPE